MFINFLLNKQIYETYLLRGCGGGGVSNLCSCLQHSRLYSHIFTQSIQFLNFHVILFQIMVLMCMANNS